jgi:hypothetical protein
MTMKSLKPTFMLKNIMLLLVVVLQAVPSLQWAPTGASRRQEGYSHRHRWPSAGTSRSHTLTAIPFDSLMDMDIVLYSLKRKDDSDESEPTKYLGAVQEYGTLSPLSAWTDEPAFGNSLEFLVDEEDRLPALNQEDVVIHSVITDDPSSFSYGSRQVGGGMGPSNPHGGTSLASLIVRFFECLTLLFQSRRRKRTALLRRSRYSEGY